MRAGDIWLFGEPETETEMDSKEKVLERFMRDQEHKATSLYDSGYRAGYEEGYANGYIFGCSQSGHAEEMNPEDDIIKVGDEVIDPNGIRAIVTNTDTHHHLFYPSNGKTWKAPKSIHLKKTGVEFTI